MKQPYKPAKRVGDVDIYIGSRIRQRRLELRLSQDDLAKKLGVTRNQFMKYETGDNRIMASRLYQLAKILGKEMDWFIEGHHADLEAMDAPSETEK